MDTSGAVLLGINPDPAASDATDVHLDVLDCVGDAGDLLQALEVLYRRRSRQSPLQLPNSTSATLDWRDPSRGLASVMSRKSHTSTRVQVPGCDYSVAKP
jgi:hypothetical protein